jgi:hypothetical protein
MNGEHARKAEALGQERLTVEFVRRAEKYNGACQYDVLVLGMVIGILHRAYEPGFVSARGCVGGSMRGYNAWYLAPTDDLTRWLERENFSCDPWFVGMDRHWATQKEARTVIERSHLAPLAGRDEDFHRFMGNEVRAYLGWLVHQDARTRPNRAGERVVRPVAGTVDGFASPSKTPGADMDVIVKFPNGEHERHPINTVRVPPRGVWWAS